MNKKLLTAAVAAALTAPAAMAGDVTIYGQMHLSTSSYDGDVPTADAWDIASHNSRIGFKGTEGLGNGLTAVWQLELGVQPSDTNNVTINNADAITYRNSFIGLTGGWGTAVIGRHDTPLKISTGSLDLFGDTIADFLNDSRPFHTGDSRQGRQRIETRTMININKIQSHRFVT